MSLRNQPYIPLYVQDFLTDEKLMECSASATGIYIRLMCILHKSDEYGIILLKQKDKQKESTCLNFAYKLAKFMPYTVDEILAGLTELKNEGVIEIDDDKLTQKRMIKDNAISEARALAGYKGGKKTQFAKAKPKANGKAKGEANSEYEIEYENESVFVEFKRWLDYKKGRNEKYKTKESLQLAYNKLVKLSGNVPEVAKEVINESMANNWSGLFPLKSNKITPTNQKPDFTPKYEKI